MEFEWKYEKQIPLIRTGGAGTNKQTEEQPLLLGGNKVSSWALKMEFTPCTAVQAGQEIKGQLTIHCQKAVNATGLEMYFRGKDITSIHYTTTKKLSGHGHSTKDHNPRDKAEICHVDIGIPQILLDKMIQNGKLVPGTHKIPYNVHVPPNSPPSMCLKFDNDEAAVEYAIRAKLKGSGKFQDYQDILPVRILAAPRRQRPDQPTQYKIGPTALGIPSVFTASNKGSITFTLHMADTTVVAGTNANIQLSIDNLDDKDAKKLLRHVEISMTQRIDIRAWSHTANHVRQVASAQFPASVFCKGGGPQLLSLPIPKNDLVMEDFETKHILLYRHELRVTFVTPLTTANPSVTIPILFVKEYAPVPALPVAVATPVPTATIPTHAITATVHKATQDTKVGINLQGQNGRVVVTKMSDTSPFRETDLEEGMIVYQINNVVIDSQLATDIHGVLGIIVAAQGDVTIRAAFEQHNNHSDLEC